MSFLKNLLSAGAEPEAMSAKPRRVSPTKRKSWDYFSLLFASALYIGLVLRISIYQLNFIESDALVPYSFITDLMKDWSNIHTWFMTPNFYFFPDLILMSIASLMSSDPWTTHILYSLAFFVLLPILVWWNLQAISSDKALNWGSSLIGSLCLICSLGTVFMWTARDQSILNMLIKPGTHGGMILAGLAFTGSVLGALQGRSSLLWVGLIVCLSGLSDELFKVQFLIPTVLLLICAAYFRTESRHRTRNILLTIGTGYLVGRLILSIIKRMVLVFPSVPLEIKWANVQKSFAALTQDLSQHPFLLGIAASNVLIVLALSIRAIFQRRLYRSSDPEFLSLIVCMAACINVAATVVAALYAVVENQRYIFALYCAPFVALAAFLSLSKGKKVHYILLPLAVISLLFIPSFESFRKPLHSYPKDLACLDEVFQKNSVETGYSGYWAAKYISFLGKEKVHLNQIFPWGGRHLWLTSESWYENARTKSGRYDVILMDQLQKERIVEKIKVDPDAVVRCGPYEAWLYAVQKRPSLLKLIE